MPGGGNVPTGRSVGFFERTLPSPAGDSRCALCRSLLLILIGPVVDKLSAKINPKFSCKIALDAF